MKIRTFKEQLLALLRDKGWSHSDLAEAINVSKSAISRIINSDERQRELKPETIERIAVALSVQAADFDLYVIRRLSELGENNPRLIALGRSILNERREFEKKSA